MTLTPEGRRANVERRLGRIIGVGYFSAVCYAIVAAIFFALAYVPTDGAEVVVPIAVGAAFTMLLYVGLAVRMASVRRAVRTGPVGAGQVTAKVRPLVFSWLVGTAATLATGFAIALFLDGHAALALPAAALGCLFQLQPLITIRSSQRTITKLLSEPVA